jgi:hypothetical protein
MGTRGPQSKAALSVIGVSGVEAVERPRPPVDLTDEQQAEWQALVNANAADRFPRGQLPMLAAHCRHVVAQRRIGSMIDQLMNGERAFDLDEYDRLLKMQERESRCLASLAVRLGFAYSTAYEKRPEKGSAAGKKPWEFDAETED